MALEDYVEFLKATKVLPEDAVYSDEQYLTFIDYDDYEDLINSSGQNIIVLGQTDCPHCIAIKPALNSVAGKYDLKINYINIDVLSEDDYSSFSKSLDEIEYNDPKYLEDGSYGTPLILVVKNGKVKNYISGERTTSQLVREFKKIGLISE